MNKSPRSKWMRIGSIGLFTIAVVLLYVSGAFNHQLGKLPVTMQSLSPFGEEKTPLHIAVIVPEKEADSYPEIEQTAKLFQQKINASGGVNGHPVQMDFYHDGNDTAPEAAVQAEQVVKDQRALVVIGHRKSVGSLAGLKVYEKASLPMIVTTASTPEITTDQPFAFRVISNTNDLGQYAALYARYVLNQQNASIIYLTPDPFGESLEASFKRTFTDSGGIIITEAGLARNNATVTEANVSQMRQVIHQLSSAEHPSPGIVFLAVSLKEGQAFARAMNAEGKYFPVVASYGMGDQGFAKEMANPLSAANFYAMSLLSFDVAGERAQNFYNDYAAAYEAQTPSWIGGTTYDALLVAAHALEKTNVTGTASALDDERKKIAQYLASINNPSQAVDGLTGQIYFDREHNFSQPPTFGVFQNGNFISAPLQLRPIYDPRLVPNLPEAIQQKNVIVYQGQYISKASVVYTGMHLNEITDVDVDKTHTFTADFFVWFRFAGDVDVGAIEFTNSVNPITLGPPIASNSTDQINYRLYRVRDKFFTTSDLQNYPFDQQELVIQFRHSTLTRDKLIYVEDLPGMNESTHSDTLLDRLNADQVFAEVTDWEPRNPRIFIDVHTNKDSFGNPVLLGSQQNMENSTFNLKIDIKRNYARFVVKNMLPLFCLMTLAYLSLFLPGYKFENFIGVITGSTLSIIFFHVNMSNRLNVGYNVALDYVFFGTYFLLIIILLDSILAWHSHQNNEKRTRRLMIFARIIYPVYLISMGILIFWLYTTPSGLAQLAKLKIMIPGL